MPNELKHLTQTLLSAARKAGAENADAIAVRDDAVNIDVLKGKLEHAERSDEVKIGLRVFVGKRQADVSASDTSDRTIAEMAERAVAMAREAPEDPWAGIADPDLLAQDFDIDALELFDPAEPPAPAFLQDMAARAEAAALSVKGVSQAQSASAGHGRHSFHLATSNGFDAGYAHSTTYVSAVAISGRGEGMERDYNAESRVFAAELPDADEVGRIAGERAVARSGAKRPPTGAWPVVFDERIASSLIGHLTSAINGAAIARGSSWARELLDQPVLPDQLSLFIDPHRPRISGSRPFDGEGLPTARRAVVKDGVLTGWILDLASARKLGLPPTGDAVRGVSGPPSPAAGNLTLTPGERSREALLADMGTGLLITSLIGSTINPTTGDYSRGAAGFWVESGEITGPVNECTIAGNLKPMLRGIIPANDARPHLSRLVPSLLVEGLTIAGA